MSELTQNSSRLRRRRPHDPNRASTEMSDAGNPFASPASAAAAPESLRSSNPITSRVAFGLWAGVLFGGTFGAGGSVLLGLVSAGLVGWTSLELVSMEQFLVAEVVAAVVGAVLGLVCGAIIGPTVAIIFNLSHPRLRAKATWPALSFSMAASMTAGAYFGFRGGGVLTESTMVAAIGLGIGVITGALGGLMLGSGVVNFSFSTASDHEKD